MNFLPFIFTFLLLLTLISSFLFTSVMRTARENKVILSQHHAYLKLLSDQNEKLFKEKEKKKEKRKNPPPNNKDKAPKKNSKEPRSANDGYEKSKLNLIPLIHGDQSLAKQVFEQTAVRLIDILYGSCDFYKLAHSKDIARTIVKQMMKDKIETLEELKFDNDELDKIYYKMLKGTNTGYPSLSEYFNLNKAEKKPIYFRYATKPVMLAALGEGFATNLFDLEKKNWLKNKFCKAMTKEEFNKLVKTNHSSLVPENLINEIFNFENRKKGLHQIHQEEKEKIRAIHKVESSKEVAFSSGA